MRYSSQVKPISYLKANAAKVLTQLAEQREPLVITQNGEAKAVLQDVASFEETQETLALLKILALGQQDVEGDQLATGLMLGATFGVTILSLAAFLALRKLSASAVANMKSDNARLAAILAVSKDLSGAPHLHAAAEIAAGCALRLSEADARTYLTRLKKRGLIEKEPARYFPA